MDNIQGKKSLKVILDYTFSIAIALIIALIFRSYVFARANVDGSSMQPTLQNKDNIFMEKVTTSLKSFTRGEIIVFDSNNNNHDFYVKRIIGLAGDKVEIKNGHVYLNNSLINEDYLNPNTLTEPITDKSEYIVPDGHVFVLGDNRTNSTDSRMLGPINVNDIKGHVIVRLFPFNKLTLF